MNTVILLILGLLGGFILCALPTIAYCEIPTERDIEIMINLKNKDLQVNQPNMFATLDMDTGNFIRVRLLQR